MAEIRIQQELKLRYLDKTATGTLTSGSELLGLPVDCLEPRFIRIDTDPPISLSVAAPDVMTKLQSHDPGGLPKLISRRGTNLWISPRPGSDYAYTLSYHARILPLGSMVGLPPTRVETNWITENAANLLLYGALLESAPFIANDERLATWIPLFDRTLAAVKLQNWNAKVGGGPITVQSDTVA